MKRLIPILLVLAAGCVSVPRAGRPSEAPREDSPAERDAKETVRDAFERLRAAWIEGDALTALKMMSFQRISSWVLERTRDASDPEFPKRLAALDSARKIDLDHWKRENRRIRVPIVNDRPSPLPEGILTSTWLVETWAHYFALDKDNLQKARDLELSEVYVEGTGASILVKVGKTPAGMYSMVLEHGIWKHDHFTPTATRVQSQ
jgi:hypothetical protein